ncbi:MAG TPA: transcription-repair coupling factor [Dictyoglomaceae bacterium]|nr:transcription-repair coupling factor [Dictyoglomaceae bacterium]HOL39152.1 transcription-repair coupling factor [Dictyoglomaceae bacterium]HOP94239.1 transcription-repair coupling factor [Dictyoglomaceae bacterium]HPP15306.1 transcription-repair coupling factor [Dictyoglomaceae bacterium]HPU42712.1 transcription-repair coupling factor [Dictyoglomaceae bacterium]
MPFINRILKSEDFLTLREKILRNESVKIQGLYKGVYPLLLSLLKEIKKPVFWVTNEEDNLNYWEDFEDLDIDIFPAFLHFPYEKPLRSHQTEGQRLKALTTLILKKNPIIVASLKSLIYPLLPKEIFSAEILILEIGKEIGRDYLENFLAKNYYKRVGYVEGLGEYAVRGGIVDIYPVTSELPIRVEFLGDEISSMRFFNLEDRKSIRNIERFILTPLHELIEPSDEEKVFSKSLEKRTSFISYLPKDTLIVFEDLNEAKILLEKWEEKGEKTFEIRKDKIKEKIYFIGDELLEEFSHFQNVDLHNLEEPDLTFSFYSPSQYRGIGEFLEKSLKEYIENGWEIYISSEHQEILRTRLKDLNIKYLLGEKLKEGFIWEKEKIVVLTDHEIFGSRRRRKIPKVEKGLKPKDLSFLKDGDYVVHVNYGIGIFRGLKKLQIENNVQEFIAVEYANNSFLYVPLEEMHLIQRYISSSPEPPIISRLETKQWEETKRRVKESAKEIAEELLKMYAQREIEEGFAFSPDNELQEELEASFPYIETEDQIKALTEIKKDMETSKPMERVLIGDVGFGKTELALRASFKAVLDGKQVAILVPTTILAYQHWRVFKERLEVFPVKVEILSRLKPKVEQKRILEGLKKGEIDIIIGTHRILQRDVQFKDLGLIIVDEEHRFGVLQKEGFKKKYPGIDILYLSATPIPRTLSMVLAGIREFSILETPPENRLPIQIFVLEYNPQVIQEGIRRELERGGQVYYVCNDISRLEIVKAFLSELVPEATYGIAHGKMDDEELTKIMGDFYDGKIDVLISTTIIESGIDVPNANTLFVENAEHMGLAQLYQLRGRIGRADKQAYAYFLHAPIKKLSAESIKRLEALKEFSSLGSGVRLALRDLEIRGAGKILGKEQHGHINSVGFYLYLQLLEEAISELKNEKHRDKTNCKITHPYSVTIPEEYIPQSSDRIYFYQKLVSIEDLKEIEEIQKEMEDIYGPIPEKVEDLFLFAKIKFLGEQLNIAKIEITENNVKFTYKGEKEKILTLPKGNFKKKGEFIFDFLYDLSNIN